MTPIDLNSWIHGNGPVVGGTALIWIANNSGQLKKPAIHTHSKPQTRIFFNHQSFITRKYKWIAPVILLLFFLFLLPLNPPWHWYYPFGKQSLRAFCNTGEISTFYNLAISQITRCVHICFRIHIHVHQSW